ncbi:MAG: hypothetical protein WCP11_00600 [Candidatus Saccharibacteria bacterium]
MAEPETIESTINQPVIESPTNPTTDATAEVDALYPAAEADTLPTEAANQTSPEGLTKKEVQNLVVAQNLTTYYSHAARQIDSDPTDTDPNTKKPYAAMILPLDDEPKDKSRVNLLTKRGIIELKILNAAHPHEEMRKAITDAIDLSKIIEYGQSSTILGLNTGGENGYDFNVQVQINDFTNENIPIIQDMLQKVEDQNTKGMFRNQTNADQSMEIKLPEN